MGMIRIMSQAAVVKHADEVILRWLGAHGRTVALAKGATLFRTGDRPRAMYYVRSGEVHLQRVTSTGLALVLQRAVTGFVAEASLTSASYHCDAVGKSDSTLIAYPIKAVLAAIDSDREVRWAWITMLSGQARRQRARVERLALKSIHERLLHLILTESNAAGHYELPGTRVQLAAELGVTPAALYRALRTMREDGTLRIEGPRLSVRQRKLHRATRRMTA
jgi:CRP/FNR family transcriptional regulator, dissimilatory nitrate respiration regulator